MKLVKKYAPNVRLIISYADSEQGHIGTIYQATNFYYTGYSTDTNLIINGKREHRRSIGSKFGTCSSEKIKKMGYDVQILRTKPKWKYIYPLDKSLMPMCKVMAKPYPKKLSEGVESNADSRLDAERVATTLPPHNGNANI